MIKRVLTIFFLFIFSLATTGVSLTLHGCEMKNCKGHTECSGKPDCKCCKTVFIYNRLTNDYTQSLNHKTEIASFVISILSSHNILNKYFIVSANELYADSSPPVFSADISFLQVYRL